MTDGGGADDWFPLAELSGRIAELVWVEERLSGLLSAWASVEQHHGTRIVLSVAGRHHRWHAEVLRECLPTSPQLAAAAEPKAPTQGWRDAVDLLHTIDRPDATAARLLCVVRELDPWLARETGALLDLARPIADAHLIRWLRFVEIDHHDDGAATAELLHAAQSNTVSLEDHQLVHALDLSTPTQPM